MSRLIVGDVELDNVAVRQDVIHVSVKSERRQWLEAIYHYPLTCIAYANPAFRKVVQL